MTSIKYFRYVRHGKPLGEGWAAHNGLDGTHHGVHAMLAEADHDPRDMLASFKDVLDEMYEVAKKKNADYTGGGDPFANFKLSPAYGVPVSRGFLVRMSDKMSRVSALIDKDPAVTGESISDSLLDLANYAILMRLYMEQYHGGNHMGREDGS